MKTGLILIAALALPGMVACAGSDQLKERSLCNSAAAERAKVFSATSKGSQIALNVVVSSLKCLDGGDLEDAYISIGQGLFINPGQFSKILTGGVATESDIRSAVTMLPGTFADEFCRQRSELSRRKHLLEEKRGLSPLTAIGLPAVDSALREVSQHCQWPGDDGEN